MTSVLLLLLACSGKEEKLEPQKPQIVRTVEVKASSSEDETVSLGTPVDVSLAFANISAIHQGFFVQSKAVKRLSRDLGTCFSEPVTVEIGYSNEDLKGHILLVTSVGQGTCVPVRTTDKIDLAPWVPVGQALASYRDYVAGTSDFRISNFSVGIRVERPDGACTWNIAGQHPPDGSLWSNCPNTGAETPCSEKNSAQTQFLWTVFSDEAAVRRCFAG